MTTVKKARGGPLPALKRFVHSKHMVTLVWILGIVAVWEIFACIVAATKRTPVNVLPHLYEIIGSFFSDKKVTGNYKDGNYSINGQYGPVGEDSIDVHLTIKDGNVETVKIIGHPFTTISKNHQDDFAKAINGVVDGKPLKGLKVDKVAGASWTSDAFNKALEVARQEASIQE